MRPYMKIWLSMVLFLLAIISTSNAKQVIYVDDDAIGSNDGSSWEDAYVYLQDALADANTAEKPVEIRVAQGTYKPDLGADITPGDRTATFQLINDVNLLGGYAGLGQSDPNARDIELCKTILSGDLSGNDVDVNEPSDLLNEQSRAENSYHVVTGRNTKETAVLDGFTIIAGMANSSFTPNCWGSGIYNYYSSPTLTNCAFSGNVAQCGSGIFNLDSSPTLINCTFSGNMAEHDGSGMYNSFSSPTLTNCTFSGNRAEDNGGGMYNWRSSPTVTNCTFTGNSARHYGGGMHNSCSSPTVSNCTFTGNSANIGGGMSNVVDSDTLPIIRSSPTVSNCTFVANNGGGMVNHYHCSPTITNCTFAANNGAGIYIFTFGTFVKPTLINCILWSNSWFQIYGGAIVSYSDIEGGWEGEGNIDNDPLFADPNKGDYHLKSQAGRWDSISQSWVQDDVTSPCIDAGDPMSPIGYEPFPNGGKINMGAYGGTAEASKSYFGKPVCETIIAGDINGDCKVDLADLEILLLHWLEDNNP